MYRRLTICIALLLLSGQFIFAQSGWQPNQQELAGPLKFLASPLLEGRKTGERGNLIAAEYIASAMEQYGLLHWFQDFDLKGALARNVLGMIKGVDTTKYVVISAHYDHLGIRKGMVYPGADDNASGVSGLLALAKRWSGLDKPPPCNLLFIAFSGEEVEILGSKYFVEHFAPGKEAILLNMKFDMISRSEPEDTARKILCIGLLKGDTYFREVAGKLNSDLGIGFELDLWETAGEGGSDYKHFAAQGIPVMAFHAGLNADYHSPADTIEKIDWPKMIRVLSLANGCLEYFLELL
jgi:acetylornithine deacetylase/succinyl-diaminopimelate desuccinylase-like protein